MQAGIMQHAYHGTLHMMLIFQLKASCKAQASMAHQLSSLLAADGTAAACRM
jgi:hypothetical protein